MLRIASILVLALAITGCIEPEFGDGADPLAADQHEHADNGGTLAGTLYGPDGKGHGVKLTGSGMCVQMELDGFGRYDCKLIGVEDNAAVYECNPGGVTLRIWDTMPPHDVEVQIPGGPTLSGGVR